MAVSPAVRVGMIIFIALVAFGAVAWFLTGYRIRAAGYMVTAVLDNALGVTKGSEVRMAGVTIGVVDDISLDRNQRAVVRMLINKRYRIPVRSRFILRVGMLIGEKYLDIVPNRETREYLESGDNVEGEVPTRIEDLLPQTQELLANLTEASENLRDLLGDRELQTQLHRSLANVERATARLDRTMAAIQGTVIAEQDEMRAIVSNVALASENVRDLTAELEQFVKQGGLQENIGETLASARRSAESLERTTVSLEKLATAPEFQEDIRGTVSEAREAVKEARGVIDRLGRIFGKGPSLTAGIPTRESSVEALYRPGDGRFRTTLSTTVPLREDNFLDLGIYDVGAGNKLILQPGRPMSSTTDLRYGIYASRLGLGLDHVFSSRTFGALNLYDPDEPRLDVRAGYNITDNWGVLLGVDSLFGDNQLTLGVRLTK